MPDFKLHYLINESPWALTELELTDQPFEDPFYELAVGGPATDIIFHENAITFSTTLEFKNYESVEKYLSYLYLNEIQQTTVEGKPIQRVTDEGMAKSIHEPSIWSEAKPPETTADLHGKPLKVPATIILFEYIPLPGTLSTVTDLRKELQRLSGGSIYGITVP